MSKQTKNHKNPRLDSFPRFKEFVHSAHNAMMGYFDEDYNPYIQEKYLEAHARAEKHLRHIDAHNLGDLLGTSLVENEEDFVRQVFKEHIAYVCELFNEHHTPECQVPPRGPVTAFSR